MDSLINNKQLALFNQTLLQAFQHFKIRLDSHSSAPVKLKVEPFFELTADPKQQSIWCIHAYYKPLAALLPSTEIYQFLCRLLQHRRDYHARSSRIHQHRLSLHTKSAM